MTYIDVIRWPDNQVYKYVISVGPSCVLVCILISWVFVTVVFCILETLSRAGGSRRCLLLRPWHYSHMGRYIFNLKIQTGGGLFSRIFWGKFLAHCSSRRISFQLGYVGLIFAPVSVRSEGEFKLKQRLKYHYTTHCWWTGLCWDLIYVEITRNSKRFNKNWTAAPR